MKELGRGKISIVIPTFNEAEKLPGLLRHLHTMGADKFNIEIIICDGNSTDDTLSIAQSHQIKVVESNIRQRSIQLNMGASVATGDILYFLHADCLPPANVFASIYTYLNLGYSFGCFRLKFDHPHRFLRLNSWFTQRSF